MQETHSRLKSDEVVKTANVLITEVDDLRFAPGARNTTKVPPGRSSHYLHRLFIRDANQYSHSLADINSFIERNSFQLLEIKIIR